MKLSHLFLLFSILVLANCINKNNNNNNNVTPITNHQQPITSTFEQSTNFINSKYLHLLDIVERMVVFHEEQKVNLKYPDLDGQKEYSPEAVKAMQEAFTVYSDFVQTLHRLTLNLLNNKQPIDQYLNSLLEIRIVYLKNRNLSIEKTLQDTAPKGLATFPTDEWLFDFLMKDYQTDPEAIAFNKSNRIYGVTKFELLNLLIKESFASCNVDELKPETINLLRASVQLHPILTNEKKGLGHPDEAGGYYAPIEAFARETLERLETIQETAKSSCGEEVKNMSGIFGLYETARKRNPKAPHKQFLIFLFNTIKASENLENEIPSTKLHEKPVMFASTREEYLLGIYQSLLDVKQGLDLEVYNAHLIPKKRLILLKNIGTPISHTIPASITDYDFNKWPYPLPDPNFLKKKELQLMRITIEVEPRVEQFTMQMESTIKQEAKGQQEASEPPLLLRQKEIIIEEKEVGKKKEPIQTSSTPKEQDTGSEGKKEVVVEKEKTKEQRVEPKSTKPASSFSFTRDWVLPHGLRAFHTQMLNRPYPMLVLNGKTQNIVDQLFDVGQQCNVTFKEFETVWQAAGGAINSNEGGSHRELIGPRQEKLFGIFAHGKSQTYGRNYVKYLQTALLYVGIRPSNTDQILK